MVWVVKNLSASAGRCKRCRFNPWVRKILWRRALFFPEESYGQRSLVGCSPYIWSHRVGHDWSNLAHTMCLNFFFFLTIVQMSSYPYHFLDLACSMLWFTSSPSNVVFIPLFWLAKFHFTFKASFWHSLQTLVLLCFCSLSFLSKAAL